MGLRYAELGLGAQQLSRLYVLSEEKVCIFMPFSLSLSLSLFLSLRVREREMDYVI